MTTTRRFFTSLALGAVVGFAGCAPVSFAAPGTLFSVGLGSPGQSFRLAPTSCFLTGSAFGHGFGLNAAAMAGERSRQIEQIQSRFNLASSDVRAQQADWKSVVASGC